ncbi:MAG TPA: VCBS repeat-containing protein [Kofleriaceae bacterium]|nr:VCBS repeat-containing protein [Kofleriaceae bacterium]
MLILAAGALVMALGGCVFYLNPQCTDQIRNGDETGLDCGGACGRCNLGEGCRVDADCDGLCVGGVCTAPPCENGVVDPGETDVDCGGACLKCAGGRSCAVDTDCFSGTCTPGAMTCSALSVSFGPEQRQYSGFKPYAMFAADLDGDSHPDLAVINEYGSSVAVFLNRYATGGALSRLDNPAGRPPDEPMAANFGPTGAYPTGGAIVDFNHDGHLDVVTADYHGNSVSVLLNAGTGHLNLRPIASYTTVSGAETSNLAVGDVNKDGNPDVLATNPQRASVSLFLGQADGTLAAGITIPVGVTAAAQPYSAAIDDFNGDGNPDLAIAEEVSGAIIVRLGKGDATFGDEVPYAIDGVRDYIVIARDVNGDHAVDLVCANRNGDTVSVLLGRGDGTFRKAIVTSVVPTGVTFTQDRPWYGPYGVTVADVNRDGVPDLVTPNFLGDNVSIMLGSGNGRFEPAIAIGVNKPADTTLTSSTPYAVVITDVDGDMRPDLVIATAVSYEVIVKLSTGQ